MRRGKCVVIDVRAEDGEGRAEGASAKARGKREAQEHRAGNSDDRRLRQGAPEVATVSSGSVEAGVWGGGVSCGLALIPVVAAEAEAAKAIAKAAGGEEVGPGEVAGSPDFVGTRCERHPHSHLHLPLLLSPRTLPYGSRKFVSVRQRPPGELSTA